MDENINLTKLDDSGESQVAGGKTLKHFHINHKPHFKHPIKIGHELILTRHLKLSDKKNMDHVSEE